MSEFNPVLREVKAPYMKITINRPDDNNRITRQANEAITAALQAAEEDETVKVIIITGNRQYFCSGGRNDPNACDEEKTRFTQSISNMQHQFKVCSKPIIAAIEGNCNAGGNDILRACDIAIARRGVTFAFPEILHNAFPVMLIPDLMEIVPKKKLLPAFYTGEPLTAEEYEACGLLTKIVDDRDFWPTVYQYVDFLVSKPQELISLGRTIYNTMASMKYEDRVTYAPGALREVWKIAGKYEHD